jgi:hypothetical protein
MRKSKLLDIMDSQIGSGWKAKSGAVSNPKALFQTGQGKVVFFNPGFEISDAERIDPPNIPESLFALQESFDADIKDFVDLGALGSDQTDRMSAMLFKMKQSMAVMQLGPIIENFKEADYLLNKKVLKMIQKFTPEKVERLIKEQPTAEFYNSTFLEYDIDFTEMPMTDYQKQAAFMQAWTMKMGGMDVPDEMLWEMSPYPISKKGMQLVQERAQAAKAQQQQELEDKQKVNELLEAKAFTDISLGEERLSRIKYDAALSEERLAAAQEERSRGVLNEIKAMKELDELDITNAEKLLGMIRGIEEEQRLASAETVVPQPAVKGASK